MNTRPLTASICIATLTLALPVFAQERYGLENAKQNMASFKTAEGLKATLFAAEPMVQNPTNIEIDPSGRVWATECVNYRGHGSLRPEGDRVVILEDTNADGEADKDITFFQSPNLKNALGICVIPGPSGAKKGTQVIVSAAPNVWLLTDTDGDDKADKEEVLLKVGGSPDHDHQIHAFVFGPDGKLYFNFGNEGKKLMWPDGSTVKDLAGNDVTDEGKPYRQGMVFRCDFKDGKLSNIETLGWNFRNNYEVAVDSFGGMWQSDNDDDGNNGVRINYVMDYGNYGYTDEMTGANWNDGRINTEADIPSRHWHLNDPGVVPNLLITGAGSPTGILVNEGTLLGEKFTNQIIHCDARPRIVRAYPTKPNGAGYTAEMVDILTSSDEWYRPSDVAIAADGALFVSDWYDPGVGGHGMGDHEKGKVMGRIYRVAPEAKNATVKPNFTSVDSAVAALQSPNQTIRTTAWRTLHAAGARAEGGLVKLWKNKNPRLRARALSLLALNKGKELPYINAGLADADSDIRCTAIRLARVQNITLPPTVVAKLIKDPSAAVRRELIISTRGKKEAAATWAALAAQYDGKDRWYLEALGIGAAGNDAIFLAAWLTAISDKWNTPAGRDIVWRLRAPKSATLVAEIIEDKSIPENEKPRFMRAFDFMPRSDEKRNALIQIGTSTKAPGGLVREALKRLKQSQRPEVLAAFKNALDEAKGTTYFVELAADFGSNGRHQELLDIALANPGHQAANMAIEMIMNEGGQALVEKALEGDKALAVIKVIGTSSSPKGVEYLEALIADPKQKPELRQASVKALASTQRGAERLVQLAKDGKLDDASKTTAGSALRMVQYDKLKNDIEKLFPAPATLGGKSLPPIAELVKTQGDITKGKIVFEKAESTCITCHKIGDKGVDFGPALTEIGSKLPKEALYDAIINPNAAISMGFEAVQLTTNNGGGGTGIIRSETAEEIALALPGGVPPQKFAKKSVIKSEKLPTSLMPSGLNQALTQDDLVDLVEYLSSLKKK